MTKPTNRGPAFRRFRFACLFLCFATAAHALGSDLTPSDLEKLGFHWPERFKTIFHLSGFQMSLRTHQHLTIDWDSIPGKTEVMSRDKASPYPQVGRFTITGIRKHIVGSPGGAGPVLSDDRLVLVAIDDAGEVRALKSVFDPRKGHSEDFSGQQPQRYDFVAPRATFDAELPDDPAITQLVVLRLQWKGTDLSLETLARIPISDALRPSPEPSNK